MPDSLSYPALLIRDHDHDRYLCALFAPASVREAWFTLFAFNHEIAAISETVSEEMIGYMRFAWWREALDEIYAGGSVRKHPVAEALAATLKTTPLPRPLFDAMLSAREENLGSTGFTDAAQWEAYFQATSSNLLALCAHAAALNPPSELNDLGIAWASIGMARVSRGLGEEEQARLLMEIAEIHLKKEPPPLFLSFKYVAEFYLARLKAGKSTGREARFPLLLSLLWKRYVKRLF